MKTAFVVLTLIASTASAEWSGIRTYVKHPQEAWSGSSDCAPCNRFCSDLRKRNTEIRALGGGGWPTGYSETGKAVVILRAMDGEPVPYFVPVVDGVEQLDKKIVGYKGDIDTVLRLWPGKTTTVRGTVPAVEKIEVQRTFVDEEPQARIQTRVIREVVRVPVYQAVPRQTTTYSVNAYMPHWTWPGDLRSHLVKHGYSLAYLNTLTMDQLEALHDADHDSGAVTPYGVRVKPIQSQGITYAAAPVVYTPMRYYPARTQSYASSGINIGGFRMGAYSYGVRSNCPSGTCP